jgi:hypothetical protein
VTISVDADHCAGVLGLNSARPRSLVHEILLVAVASDHANRDPFVNAETTGSSGAVRQHASKSRRRPGGETVGRIGPGAASRVGGPLRSCVAIWVLFLPVAGDCPSPSRSLIVRAGGTIYAKAGLAVE